MGCTSLSETLLVILVIALVFGAGRLPMIGEGLGRAIRNFNRALRGDNEIDVTPQRKLAEPERDSQPDSDDEAKTG